MKTAIENVIVSVLVFFHLLSKLNKDEQACLITTGDLIRMHTNLWKYDKENPSGNQI